MTHTEDAGMARTPLLRRPWVVVASRVLAVVIIALLALVGVQREQEGNRWFDIFDEAAHFDYVLKLTYGEIPSWGSTYEQRTMLIAECMGNALTNPILNCDIKERNPKGFPPDGYNYEAQQPPLGYLAYVPGLLLSGDRDPGATLNYVRDTGGTLLLVVTSAILFALATQMRLGFFRTTLLAGITLLAPMTIHAYSTVSNDPATVIATLIFASLLLAARGRGARVATILGLIAGLVVGGTKSSAILVPAAMLLALIGFEMFARLRSNVAGRQSAARWIVALLRRTDVRFVLTSLIVSCVVTLAFTAWQSIRGSVPSGVVLHAVMGILPLVDQVQISTIVSSVANLSNNWLGASNGLVSDPQLFVALNGLLLVLVGVAFVLPNDVKAPGSQLFATTWAIVVVVFSVAWPVLLLIQGHFNFDTPQRYGLLILPLAALAATDAVRRKGRDRSVQAPRLGTEPPVMTDVATAPRT